MARVSMRKVTKKPADVQWWFMVEPVKAAIIKKFCDEYEGLTIEYSKPDDNTIITNFTFDSEEIFGKFMIDMHGTSAFASRTTYNTQNGVTETNHITAA